jgi:catechol 2,3-dioxygenase-like lactoylglutathione lyase family enzyme
MPVEVLEHYTIRCASLERTRDFYADIVGLTVGPRPNFNFAGYWLYCGGSPVIHLVEARGSQAATPGEHSTGALDHVAFRGVDLEKTRAHFRANGIAFTENAVPDFELHQIFLHDPDGIMVELNFRGIVA